jgi:Predicted PP-loop superfamily ATPase
MVKALVIFSGGQDSTTCLFKALKDYGQGNVETISFAYGQKHEYELEVAAQIAKELGVPNVVMDTSLFGQIADSSLLKGGGEFASGDKYPNTFVDGRNMLFLLLAAI